MRVWRSISSSLTVAEMEARRVRHDPTELFTRLIQPALWLLIFGEVFTSIRAIDTAPYTYLQFITPGILAQSVLFVSIFYGITVVWERDMGLLTKLLSTPAPRFSVVAGKSLAAGVRGLLQAVMIFVLALVLGIKLRLDPLDIAGVFFLIVINAMCFSSLSMLLAGFLKTRDRMLGIGQAMTMPLFFGSNAIYPISLMPTWLQSLAAINPLSYVVQGLRAFLLSGDYSTIPLDLAVVGVFTVVMLTGASLMIRRLVE
ncbi:MAG TPA: ABC transporter permease [Nitrososphaerales archaeon]|nr:ABC transporter permease [Nitrososphaerales archaeon]